MEKLVEAKQSRPVWYLAGPFYQYEEDVKSLAAKHGLRIIDATVTDNRDFAAPQEDLPKVTIKPEFRPKPKAKPEQPKADGAK